MPLGMVFLRCVEVSWHPGEQPDATLSHAHIVRSGLGSGHGS